MIKDYRDVVATSAVVSRKLYDEIMSKTAPAKTCSYFNSFPVTVSECLPPGDAVLYSGKEIVGIVSAAKERRCQ